MFRGKATFAVASFDECANFNEATFQGKSNFYGDVYSSPNVKMSEANFYNVKFEEDVNFSYRQFHGITTFSGANFEKSGYFYRTKFEGKANFSGSEFREAYFSQSELIEGANFAQANFHDAKFINTNFQMANFSEATFLNKAKFTGHFHGQTNFNYVIFEGKEKILFETEDLSNVSFMNSNIVPIIFNPTTRWGKQDHFKVVEEEWFEESLRNMLFSWEIGDTDANKVQTLRDFIKELYTNGLHWEQKVPSEILNHIEHLQFSKLDENTIQISDTFDPIILKNASMHPDWNYFFPQSIKISPGKTKASLESINGLILYEFLIRYNTNNLMFYDKPTDLEAVVGVYRNLRENYEHRLRYDEAGNLFIKEMELKRRYREVPTRCPIKLKLLSWYNKLKKVESKIPDVLNMF